MVKIPLGIFLWGIKKEINHFFTTITVGGAMLTLKNISKEYNGVKVLKDINLQFRDKELVAILGPSGCGKTTLLNIIATVEKVDSGTLYYGNSEISSLSDRALNSYRQHYISYIFQNYNLINHLNVKDNIAISCELKKQKYHNTLIKTVMEKFNLNGLEKQDPKVLSGGEKQRVTIARSIINESSIILADEPTGALDSHNSHLVMQLLYNLAKEKLVILVTHNEILAKTYATRIIRLSDGQIISDSNPFNEKYNLKFLSSKTRLSFFTIIKLAYNNFKSKKVRSYLTVFAYSIGLISLTLVLCISKGFNLEIKNFEAELYNYPIIISKEAVNINGLFDKKEKHDLNQININKRETVVHNKIDEKLLSLVDSINLDILTGKSFYKEIATEFRSVSHVNPNNQYFNLLSGRYPEHNHEVMLLLDSNYGIDEKVAVYLDIRSGPINSVINQKLDDLTIVGVVQSEHHYFRDLNGILYDDSLFDAEITDIFLFAKSYEHKAAIKEHLKDYYLLDEAKTVLDLTDKLMRGIVLILMAFSLIALLVSTIMIAIITYIAVLERLKEIGLLKTLGASKNDIKNIFLIENLIIAFLASSFTLELSFGITKIINNYVLKQLGIIHIAKFDGTIVLMIVSLSVLLTALAGWLPAHFASKKKIVEILHSE